MARDRSDRLDADLERGFTALEDGRIDDAASALERCQRIDKTHPGVIQLAASCADAAGDVDEAMAAYKQLVALNPDDPMPRLSIARLELRDLDDPDAALATLAAAFEFIDDEDDLLEGVLLRAEAQLVTGDLEAARETLGELSSSVVDDPALALDLADLATAAEDPEAAKRWIEIARKSPELLPDALHVLGRVHELTGDRPAMIEAWLEVRKLDLAAPAPELSISDDDVEQIASETFGALPDEVRKQLENVPILIEDVPSEELVKDGVDPRLLGLFQGTPMPEGGDLAPSVTTILLFPRNLAREAQDADELADQIRITVLHETAHYFGLDDEDLAAIGLE